ncbi:MAG: MFS transporter [Chitinophagaceae bacterium]|nr:MFS transporter [Chitinophagaceae bacterium]MCB0740769.1 MFS transporter [Chitinophagaceae bacterium]HQV05245.1 MFS transporter [Chitinophagaceae bacterium]
MQTASKKIINAWAMYDWANSSYNLVITSTIFPAYFEAIAVDNKAQSATAVTFLGRQFENSALYNYTLAFAMLIVAVISPLLSSIADYKGNKKKFMNFFLTMGSIACAFLFFFNTGSGTTSSPASNLGLGLICMLVACIGFWGSIVFYNSFLPEIAAPQDRDRVSAKGFAYGYIGSVILQVICFVFVFFPGILGGFENNQEASTIQFRLSFFLVGLWWWGFGQYSLRYLPKPEAAGSGDLKKKILSKGYKELQKVWQQLKQLPVLKRYLAAFFFFDMGVQTIMLVAALYGKSELQIPTTNLIISILIIQLIAIPGAYVISWLSSKMGNIKTLMVLVLLWIALCFVGYILPVGGVYPFYGLAIAVGFVMGGTQSLSRSTYAKLMPVTKDTASFFSFYDVTEKIAAVLGIFSFGYITELTGSQRGSVLALASFFCVGLLLLIYTNMKKPTLILEK